MTSNWNSYKRRFRTDAENSGFTSDEISAWLKYARNLDKQNLPIIYDQVHFSLFVGYKVEYLRRISNSQKHFYRTFEIPKRSGGKRTISEPLPSLKEIQRWILDNILIHVPVSSYSKAFIKRRSIKANAAYHIDREILLTIDLEDFFGSLKYPKIHSMFSRLGYANDVSTMLSNICTLDKKLPQGAPTSPTISNILLILVDKRIANFTNKHGIRYTRYADDMAFSGAFEPGMVVKFVRKVLAQNRLRLNEKKIRVMKGHQRQLVTGIVVNEKLQAPRVIRRKLRQSVYYIEKFGLASHLDKTENKNANHIRHLMGLANHILFLNPNDTEVREYLEILRNHLE
jgi:RNA-directed DNA polymerase